jgi:hypothetical protein
MLKSTASPKQANFGPYYEAADPYHADEFVQARPPTGDSSKTMLKTQRKERDSNPPSSGDVTCTSAPWRKSIEPTEEALI